jgi:hypothetical protein
MYGKYILYNKLVVHHIGTTAVISTLAAEFVVDYL